MLLQGSKEIAHYLRCGVRTAQRWAQQGMPTRRIRIGPRGPVIAYLQEIDQWLKHELAKSRGRREARNIIRRSRELRVELEKTRQSFRREVDLLNRELAALRARPGNNRT
jgi:hypothetical protein